MKYFSKIDEDEIVIKSVCKETLAVKDAKIIKNMHGGISNKDYFDLWLCWSVDVDYVEAAVKDDYLREVLLNQLYEIGKKITIFEVNEARKSLEAANKEIEQLKKKVEELTPYKHFAEVSKEINGVKGIKNAK